MKQEWTRNHVPVRAIIGAELDVKNCPFCESNNYALFTHERGGHVCCMRCGAEGPHIHVRRIDYAEVYAIAHMAVSRWNARSTADMIGTLPKPINRKDI